MLDVECLANYSLYKFIYCLVCLHEIRAGIRIQDSDSYAFYWPFSTYRHCCDCACY